MAETVRLRREGEHVAVITLDNPPMNALGREARAHLRQALADLQSDTRIRCAVLTGAGEAFTAGADLKEIDAMSEADLPAFSADFEALLLAVEGFRATVIAAIGGHCLGGGLELALCCDIRLASTAATFVASGVNVGLLASFVRLPRTIGLGRAKQMLLTGRAVSAAQAEQWGLVTGVYAPEELEGAALALAQHIATRAPLSVDAAKAGANRAFDLSPAEVRELWTEKLAALYRSEDRKEAVRAFLEKRRPVYRRR